MCAVACVWLPSRSSKRPERWHHNNLLLQRQCVSDCHRVTGYWYSGAETRNCTVNCWRTCVDTGATVAALTLHLHAMLWLAIIRIFPSDLYLYIPSSRAVCQGESGSTRWFRRQEMCWVMGLVFRPAASMALGQQNMFDLQRRTFLNARDMTKLNSSVSLGLPKQFPQRDVVQICGSDSKRMSYVQGGWSRNESAGQVQETLQAAGSDQMNNLLSLNKAKPSGSAAERPSQPLH